VNDSSHVRQSIVPGVLKNFEAGFAPGHFIVDRAEFSTTNFGLLEDQVLLE
jgi:hypothetical protein